VGTASRQLAMTGRRVYALSDMQVKLDSPTLATILDGLKDFIPYQNLAILQHMHHWGHALINLKVLL